MYEKRDVCGFVLAFCGGWMGYNKLIGAFDGLKEFAILDRRQYHA